MSRTDGKRHLSWHETYTCKCRIDASVCNEKQRWSNDKCRCECEELIDRVKCDDGFIWSTSICEYECDKLFDVGEYFNYKYCNCRKKLIDKLVEECSESIDGNEMIRNGALNDYGRVYESSTLYMSLIIIRFKILMGTGNVFICFCWCIVLINCFIYK